MSILIEDIPTTVQETTMSVPTKKAPARSRAGEEIWETTTDGTVWVMTTDKRGNDKEVKVGGKVGSRLRIMTEDREISEDAMADPSEGPFRNGLLVRIDAGAEAASADEDEPAGQAMTTEDLMVGFAKSGNAYQSFVKGLNEVNARRMLAMVPVVDASTSQSSFLQDYVRSNFRPPSEGAQPTYTEMQLRGDVAGASPRG